MFTSISLAATATAVEPNQTAKTASDLAVSPHGPVSADASPMPNASLLENESLLEKDQFVAITTTQLDGQVIDRHQVIFDSGVAYDVVGNGSRFITVFGDDSVTLLDRMTQVRCEVPHATLVDVTRRLADATRQSPQSSDLGVDVAPVRRGDDYAVAFGPFQYNLTTVKPPRSVMAADYAKFADAAVRLNVVQQVGPPPFARLALSRRIASDGRLPIKATISVNGGDKQVVYQISTQIQPATDADVQQTKTFASLVKLYQAVDLSEFPARQ